MRRLREIKPVKGGPEYRRVWRIADGAIRDCIRQHPEYFEGCKDLRQARESLLKRVTGAILADQAEVAKAAKGPIREKRGLESRLTSGMGESVE